MHHADDTTTLKDLKTAAHRFAEERDWAQFHSPKNLSMALAAEAGELMEHFLWCDPAASKAVLDHPAKRKQVEDELADIIIYAVRFADRTDIDIAAAVRAKMEQNARKYPVEKARGRSEKYTEL